MNTLALSLSTVSPSQLLPASAQTSAPRGNFSFDPVTQNVIDPVYVRQVVKGPDGLVNRLVVSLGTFADRGK